MEGSLIIGLRTLSIVSGSPFVQPTS
ncbi:hypothetical protein A2U01_0114255, partial [Trifolium medium]|nr:hypothetical protein [Trifolium medium]